jgi:hypothetical protein
MNALWFDVHVENVCKAAFHRIRALTDEIKCISEADAKPVMASTRCSQYWTTVIHFSTGHHGQILIQNCGLLRRQSPTLDVKTTYIKSVLILTCSAYYTFAVCSFQSYHVSTH